MTLLRQSRLQARRLLLGWQRAPVVLIQSLIFPTFLLIVYKQVIGESVLHLTGGAEATEVRASGLSVLSSHLDMANARVEFANGAVALATASRVSRERVRRLRLFQPNGYLSLDLATGGGEFMRLRSDWRPGTGTQLSDVVERLVLQAPEADALRLELQSFVHAVRGDREVVVGGAEGRAALALALRVAAVVQTAPLAAPAAG